MRIVWKRTTAAVMLSTASLVGVGFFALAAPPTPTSKPTPPPSHSIEEARAIIDASRARNEQFLKDFVASGRNPRSLPRLMTEATADVAPSLDAAVHGAQLVARASVIRTTFSSGPDGFPVTTSTLRLLDVLKSPDAAAVIGAQIQVLQIGGPVPQPQPSQGGLVQVTTDELLLSGDDIVILANFRPDLGAFQPLAGAGLYFNQNGRIAPEDANRFAGRVAGVSPSALLAAMRQFVP